MGTMGLALSTLLSWCKETRNDPVYYTLFKKPVSFSFGTWNILEMFLKYLISIPHSTLPLFFVQRTVSACSAYLSPSFYLTDPSWLYYLVTGFKPKTTRPLTYTLNLLNLSFTDVFYCVLRDKSSTFLWGIQIINFIYRLWE